MTWDLFLAHATRDLGRAEELYGHLVAPPPLRVFLDSKCLRAGDDWSRAIPRAQDDSRMTVALVSASADGAYYLGEEVHRGIQLHRDAPTRHRVVPVLLHGTPRDVTKLPYGLGSLTPIVEDDVGGMEGVARELRALLSNLAPVPPRSDPVSSWLAYNVDKRREMPIIGFDQRMRRTVLSLDDVFVPLRVSTGRGGLWGRDLDEAESGKAAAGGPGRGDWQVVELPGAIAITEGTKGAYGIAVVGDPGAGKTTLLKHVFLRAALEGTEALGYPPGLVPVLLRCSRIEPAMQVARGLQRAVEAEADKDGYREAALEIFSRNRPLLFLLDGLDEVRDEPSRERMCRWLEDEVRRFPGSRFITSCRAAAWQRAGLSSRFVEARVQSLDPDGVRLFVRKWRRAVERVRVTGAEDPARVAAKEAEADVQADAAAEDLLGRVLSGEWIARERLAGMARNPLLLAQICLLHFMRRKLPDQRVELYDECLGLLLSTWAEHDDRGYRHLPNRPSRQVLQPLAWAMHTDHAEQWPRARVLEAIAEPLSQVRDLDLTPEEFLRRASHDCGVLAERDIDVYASFHLSLQEYLAACHAVEVGLVTEMAQHAEESWWREPILLAAGMPAQAGRLLEFFADKGSLAVHVELMREAVAEARGVRVDAQVVVRCFEAAVAKKDEASARAVLEVMGARAPKGLVEAVERAWPASARVGVVAVVMGGELSQTPREGHPFAEPMTGMRFVWVPPGKFLMGSSNTKGERNYDEEASDRELPAHEVEFTNGFWIGEHPVTNAEYRRFIEKTAHREPEGWTDARLNDPLQPVTRVSWEDAQAICAWLTGAGAGAAFGLPFEEEWEYAARGPENRKYPWASGAPNPERACFGGRGSGKTGPSRIGLHPSGASWVGAQDMAGNVWEWCETPWKHNYVKTMTNVSSSERGMPRVVRGGSWDFAAGFLRSAIRFRYWPEVRGSYLGFRVVCRPPRERG